MTARNYGKFCKAKWCFSSHKDIFKSVRRTGDNRELLKLGKSLKGPKDPRCELMKCDVKLRLVLGEQNWILL